MYIREGTYNQTLRPDRSGTQGNYITYAAYNSEEVIITGVTDGIDLRNRHYIKIDGLKLLDVGGCWVNMNMSSGGSSTYNIIQNCHMETAYSWAGIWLEGQANYNKILDNRIIGYATPSDSIYLRSGPHHNVIEGNTLLYAAHKSINIQLGSDRNVVRENRIWNPWHGGIDIFRNADETLVEGNVILDCGENHTEIPRYPGVPPGEDDGRDRDRNMPRESQAGIQLGASNCVVRNNVLVNAGCAVACGSGEGVAANDNRLYNNVHVLNHRAAYVNGSSGFATYGNVLRNEIYCKSQGYEIHYFVDDQLRHDNYFVSNGIDAAVGNPVRHYSEGFTTIPYLESRYPAEWYGNSLANVSFANAAGVNNVDNLEFDPASLHLRPNSPMIDAGAFLTTATSAGSGTVIPVQDASYFYDGWGIPGEQGDLIQLEGQTQTARIVSIDYGNNRITVDRSMSWAAGRGVSLPYHGSAPDIGAFEYGSADVEEEPPVEPTYTLTVGGTNGSVTKDPDSPTYNAGQTVELTAAPSAGYSFTGWSGDLSGSTNPATITMNANKSVTATFTVVAPTTYTLAVGGTNGSVTKDPDSPTYNAGQTVELTAAPSAGYEFTGWSGDLSGSTNPTTITMNANKSITASFAAIAPTTYTLSVSGAHGTVTKTPNQSSYTAGATVTVQAIAADGYEFTSWSGDLSGSANPASVTMNSNKSITAVFTRGIVDDAPPVAVASSPPADAVQVPRNSLVALHISDEGDGVDADTVTISIDGATVYSGGGPHLKSDTAVCRRTGSKTSYTYTYQSETEFAFGETITVRVNAADLNGNAMSEYVYSFKTEMWAFGGNRRVSWGPAGLEKGRPATASDSDGNLWVVWHAGPVGQRDIYASTWGPQDDRFAEPIRLTSDAADQANPDIAIGADDKLYVVWQDNRRGNWDVYLRTSSDGSGWSAETRITDSDDNQAAPVIAVDNASGCHVAWEDDSEGHSDIYIASSSDGFVSQAGARVTSNTSNQTDPDIAVDASGNVYLVWTDARSGSGDIYGAASNNGPWTNVALVTGAGNQYAAALATEAAGAWLHLVWVHEVAAGSDVRYAATEGMPASPLAGVNLADDTSGADQLAPTVAAAGRAGNGLKVFVCWQDWRNVTNSGRDTDLYFVEVKEAGDTNVLVGDGGIGSAQSAPAIGVDSRGFPYAVWTDDRDGNAEIYHAGTTSWDPEVLASQAVTASEGGTVGVASPSNVDDVSVVIPPAAASQDVTITVTRIQNAPAVPSSGVLSYEFGPSGLQFSQPVTITIPYDVAEFGDEQPTPWWYDSRTGGLSQEGITDIEYVALSPTVAAMRFKTTHFTPYYLISGSAMDEIGGGSAGGGCSLSYGDNSDPMGYFVPYLLIAFVMMGLRIRDARRRAKLR